MKFQEQGVTTMSILLALGTIIAAIIGLVKGVDNPMPASTSSRGSGIKDWVKKQLSALGCVLFWLDRKATTALFGIIGSVVSWLFNALSQMATWLTSNLWAAVIAVAGLLLLLVR